MQLDYVTVDVFTDQKFGGNPLAVVLNGDGLSTDQMQKIAREFNYSETTFVRSPKDAANTAEVRIFMPHHELPFAGHPNVGTAYVLASRGDCFGKRITDRIVFEEKAGLVPISVSRDATGAVTTTELTAPAPLKLGAELTAEDVAALTGLSAGDVSIETHAPTVAGVGVDILIAELVSMDALKRAQPISVPEISAKGSTELYIYVKTGETSVAVRMFAPTIGIQEDPATGAGAAAFTGFAGHLLGQDGTTTFEIVQGVEIGRPSLIHGSVDVEGGSVQAVRIKGSTVPMMQGTLEI